MKAALKSKNKMLYLTIIGIWATICHRQQAACSVADFEIFVWKFRPINAWQERVTLSGLREYHVRMYVRMCMHMPGARTRLFALEVTIVGDL
jgi:hypothetical protein